MHEIVMPKAGMAMEEGRIIRWLKKEGDKVSKGEPIAEIETDKVTIEEESPADGIVLKLLANEGDTVPVVTPIAYIGDEGEVVPDSSGVSKDKETVQTHAAPAEQQEKSEEKPVIQSAGEKTLATPLAKRLAAEKGVEISNISPSNNIAVKASDVIAAARRSTPLAKTVADTIGVDINAVTGTGINGKVFKDDVLKYATETRRTETADKRIPIKGMRKVIFERMSRSHLDIPPVTMTAKVYMDKLLEMRQDLNQIKGVKLTINDFIIKAVSLALEECPYVNAWLEGEELIYKSNINIGMAVGMEEGLIVPVIRDANRINIFRLSEITRDLAARSRANKIKLDELEGATFTVSNLGMYNIINFTPIINPPEIAILGVCAIEDEYCLTDGMMTMRKVMNICVTFDHRALDGVNTAVFLNKTKNYLEAPARLLV